MRSITRILNEEPRGETEDPVEFIERKIEAIVNQLELKRSRLRRVILEFLRKYKKDLVEQQEIETGKQARLKEVKKQERIRREVTEDLGEILAPEQLTIFIENVHNPRELVRQIEQFGLDPETEARCLDLALDYNSEDPRLAAAFVKKVVRSELKSTDLVDQVWQVSREFLGLEEDPKLKVEWISKLGWAARLSKSLVRISEFLTTAEPYLGVLKIAQLYANLAQETEDTNTMRRAFSALAAFPNEPINARFIGYLARELKDPVLLRTALDANSEFLEDAREVNMYGMLALELEDPAIILQAAQIIEKFAAGSSGNAHLFGRLALRVGKRDLLEKALATNKAFREPANARIYKDIEGVIGYL